MSVWYIISYMLHLCEVIYNILTFFNFFLQKYGKCPYLSILDLIWKVPPDIYCLAKQVRPNPVEHPY